MSVPNSVNHAFAQLNASSNSIVFEALSEIRKFISKHERNVKLMREKNVLKELVNILGKPNEKNLDLTLSILGNCCLEYECRIELFSLGIVRAVVTVFNSTGRDAIQGRACRVIGNLALTHTIAVKLHKENVIGTLVNVVDNGGNNSIASQQMAVRALRILWSVESERVSMLELNVVRKVAMLLTTPYEKKEQRELLKTVMKALTVFTHHCSEQCAVQVHADGPTLQALLSYCMKDETRSSVIICIYNMCHIGSSRPVLGSAGVVKLIIKELSGFSSLRQEPTESQTALISSLCLLCRESVNRAKIRRAGGLPIILSILRDCPKTSLQSSALHALVQFVYDEVSLQELLKEGMINVLVMKLSNFIKERGSEHEVEYKKDAAACKRRHVSSSSCCTAPKSQNKEEMNRSPRKSESDKGSEGKSQESSQFPDVGSSCESWKRFRISSPSYQAVVQEIGYTQRSRDKSNNTAIASPSHSGDFSYRINSPEQSITSDYQSGDWSPGSPRSMCFSPESSPAYGRQWSFSPTSAQVASPFDVWSSTSSPESHTSADGDIREVYSPVCHDAQSDDEEYNDENKGGCTTSSQNMDEQTEEQSVDLQSLKCDSPSSNWELVSVISSGDAYQSSLAEEGLLLILISRISHMETIVEDLVASSTLSTLLNYIRLLRNPQPRAGRILGRIVRTHHYFIHLLTQQFVLNIHANLCQPVHISCVACEKLNATGKNLISKLSLVAETGFGEGELSYHLLKAETSVRHILAVTIPFIIKRYRLLKKLLIDCKGLDILQNIVKSYPVEPGPLSQYIPTCLSLLASSLKITCPVHVSSYINEYYSADELDDNFDKGDSFDNTTFLLDDGDTVIASRTFLSTHSPVFEAMLRGSFKEAVQKSVLLQDLSADSFKHLMYVMKLGKVPHCLPNFNLNSALELLLILDRFLVPGSEELSDFIICQFLQPDTACDVYINVNRYSGSLKVFDEIRLKTVECLLVSDISDKKRRDIFRELFETTCSLQVQNDMFDILREKFNYGSSQITRTLLQV